MGGAPGRMSTDPTAAPVVIRDCPPRPAWMPGPVHDLLSDSRRALVVVALSACVLRLGSLLVLGPLTDAGGDVPSYTTPGVRLAEGLGYTRSDGTAAVKRAPGFPVQIAISQWLTGDLHLAYLLNAAWGAAAVLAVYALGRRAFGGTAIGASAALLYAALPQPIFWQRLLLSESLHTFLVLIWALVTVGALEKGSGVRFAASGVVLAAILYVRPASALLLGATPALALLSRSTRRRAAWLALASVVALLAILPWSLRNHRVSGHVIPISTGFGAAAYLGNLQDGGNGGFSRDYAGAPVPEDVIQKFNAADARSDWEGDAYAQSLVPGLLRARLTHDFWAWLIDAKLANLSRFFFGRPFATPAPWWSDLQSGVVLVGLLLTALSFPALVRRVNPLGPLVFCWLLASLLTMHVLTTSVRRYSEPVLPFLALGSMAALFGYVPAFSTRRGPATPVAPHPGSGSGGGSH
jgi:4-amino-4-deoxy-L-arabinose transferase-like glycosyltransferase